MIRLASMRGRANLAADLRRRIAGYLADAAAIAYPADVLVRITSRRTARAGAVERASAAVQAAHLLRLVEAIKGRGLLPGETVETEAALAANLLRRIDFRNAYQDRRGRLFLPISTELAGELAGLVAPPADGAPEGEVTP